MNKNYKSRLTTFNALIEALEQIPTIGKKSALKMAYTLGVENKFLGIKIAHCLEEAISHTRTCEACNALSESQLCEICSDEHRLNGQLCIILHPRDIFILEENTDYEGRYFVLSSIEDFNPHLLRQNIQDNHINEIIFAFSPTLANEAIMLFIEDKLSDLNLSFSKIAQGVPTGIGLDNIDSLSLSRALQSRTKL